MLKNEIIFFETKDKEITLPVQVNQETVWLNRNQIAELFGRDVKTIGKHINNALREELEPGVVVAKFATTTPHGALEGKGQTHQVEYYNDENKPIIVKFSPWNYSDNQDFRIRA